MHLFLLFFLHDFLKQHMACKSIFTQLAITQWFHWTIMDSRRNNSAPMCFKTLFHNITYKGFCQHLYESLENNNINININQSCLHSLKSQKSALCQLCNSVVAAIAVSVCLSACLLSWQTPTLNTQLTSYHRWKAQTKLPLRVQFETENFWYASMPKGQAANSLFS